MKTCSKCGETKPEGEFRKGRRQCKECFNEYQHKYYADNCDKAKERHRKWNAANPEKVNEWHRKYYAANLEKVMEYNRKWRDANPDKMMEYNRKQVSELRDSYVIGIIKQNTSLTREQIKEFPQLIELQKLIIKTKRL
jgi:hypothetical protein